MKTFLITLISLLLTSPFIVNAQPPAEKKAKEILDKVSAKTKTYSTIKFEFTYKMENKTEKINENKAGVIFIKGDKYKLTIAGQIIFCDGKTIWNYMAEEKEVTINAVQPDDDASINLKKLLATYGKNYKPKLIKEDVDRGKAVYVIDLVPYKGKKFYKVRLLIDKATYQITSSTTYDKNGTTYSYIVNKFTADLPMNDTEFTFNAAKYPGVEVIDMR